VRTPIFLFEKPSAAPEAGSAGQALPVVVRQDAHLEIARRLDCTLQTVRQWRRRFNDALLEGVGDRLDRGRRPTYGPRRVAEHRGELSLDPPVRQG
jgi:transposase-like protein